MTKACEQLLGEDNTNLTHLVTNIRRDRRFETLLMDIMSYEEGMRFNPRDELISELTTYGVIEKGIDGKCEIVNPIYLHCIIEAFTPAVNGLERNYFAEDNSQGFRNQQKYIIETKIWRGDIRYQAGKKQLAAYLKVEGVSEGYYVVFDHRRNPEPRVQTETVDGVKIRSYVIPIVQEAPSAAKGNA